MRLFISLELPEEVKDNLFRIRKHISPNLAKVKWVFKKDIHVTLKFLENVEKFKLEVIKERLSKIKFNSSKLRFKEIGFFSYKGEPNIIRLVFYKNEEMLRLQRKIDEELLDIFPESQEFILHLTLGRIKLIKKDKEFFEKIKSFNFFKEEFDVDNFHLVESKPIKGGHVYKIIHSFES